MSEHSIDLGHRVQFQDTRILPMKTGCKEHIIREAIEIELHPNNVNREGFSLSKAWKPLLQTLKEWRKPLPSVRKVDFLLVLTIPNQPFFACMHTQTSACTDF
jgi:hypothetical protein